MLLTEDLEKTPDNAWCSAAAGQPACSPGFFDAVSAGLGRAVLGRLVRSGTPSAAHLSIS